MNSKNQLNQKRSDMSGETNKTDYLLSTSQLTKQIKEWTRTVTSEHKIPNKFNREYFNLENGHFTWFVSISENIHLSRLINSVNYTELKLRSQMKFKCHPELQRALQIHGRQEIMFLIFAYLDTIKGFF